jgi:SAM-dependent methyltransferase
LEIGTGWRPFLPFIMSLGGGKRIYTFDVNPWLTLDYAVETYLSLEPHLSLIAERLGTDAEEVRAHYSAIGRGTQSLSSLLAAAGVDYHYPGDASRTGLPDGSIDVVCSSNVLEHVSADMIRAIHAESFRIVRLGGLAVHRVNPGDHFAHADRSITGSNFLRYSEKEWKWYGGSGLSFHNRLRCVQHRDILRAAGFVIHSDRVRIDQRAFEAIRAGSIPIHPDFLGYTPEELAADYTWLVGRKPLSTL